MSGLELDREYVVQGGDFNIKSEEGKNQRPDVIVLLPEQRHFVIDSKVTFSTPMRIMRRRKAKNSARRLCNGLR